MQKNTQMSLTVKGIIKANLPFFALLLMLGITVFGKGLTGKFISGDDFTTYVTDPQVKDLGASLATLTLDRMIQGVIYATFGPNPVPFHVLSLGLHIVNAILVFILVFLLLNKKAAAITSALFLVHPMVTEAVAWVSGKPYIYSSLIALLTLIPYVFFRRTQNKKFYYGSLSVFVLGLGLAKQVWLLPLPITLVLVDALVLNIRLKLKTLTQVLPFFLVSAAVFFFFFYGPFITRVQDFDSSRTTLGELTATPVLNRLPYTFFMSAKLLVLPIQLSLYHEGEVYSPTEYAFMILVAAGLALCIVALLVAKKHIYAGLILLILTSLLPAFSPSVIAWFFAERYLYFGTIFFTCILACLFIDLESKTKIQNLALYMTASLLIAFSIRTALRTNDWQNSLSLWSATQKVAPNSYRVYNNLGDAYGGAGNVELAIASFKKAIEINPKYADALHNLGYTYLQLGDYTNAKKYLTDSYQVNPNLYQAAIKLGQIAIIEKDFEKAKGYFEEALVIHPNDPDALRELSSLSLP